MKKQKRLGFEQFAALFGNLFGSPISFTISFVIVVSWLLILGPIMRWSNTWQLLINTPTTIIELFAAITIQYVGNRIQRQQQANEEKMLKILEHLDNIVGNKSHVPPADF